MLCTGAMLVLGACSDQSQIASIRPGLTSQANLDTLKPPSGRTYNYSVTQDGAPVPAALTLTSRRINATTYDYVGSMAFKLPPNTPNLEGVAADIAKVFGVNAPKIRNGKVFIPMRVRTDNRFRGKSSTVFAGNDRYVPHDCVATLGQCTYRTISGKRDDAIEVETTEKDGVWRSVGRQVDNPSRKRIMTYSLDRNGVLIDLVMTNWRGGKRLTQGFQRQGFERASAALN